MMDDQVDITKPEALVYELDANGEITGLVAHEYIVPIDAWTKSTPPQLFGMDFHKHPTLPLWVLHTWLWKDNPAGVFEDWNPAVRQCPDTVAIFGDDLPATTPDNNRRHPLRLSATPPSTRPRRDPPASCGSSRAGGTAAAHSLPPHRLGAVTNDADGPGQSHRRPPGTKPTTVTTDGPTIRPDPTHPGVTS